MTATNAKKFYVQTMQKDCNDAMKPAKIKDHLEWIHSDYEKQKY